MNFKRYAMSWIGRMAAAASVVLSLAQPAQAAYYTGVWDPNFGSPFTNLGWRGSAEFYVPDFCKATGTADVSNPLACDGLAEFQSATVQFYDVTDPGLDTIISIGFDPLSLDIGTLRFVDGALTQLTTTLSNFVLPDADLTKFGVSRDTEFSLQFTLEGPRLAWGSCNVDTGCEVSGFNDSVNFPPTFVITEISVPEPGTPVLAAVALLMLAVLRLRARRQRQR